MTISKLTLKRYLRFEGMKPSLELAHAIHDALLRSDLTERYELMALLFVGIFFKTTFFSEIKQALKLKGFK